MRLTLLGLLVATPALAKPGDGVKEEDIAPKSEVVTSVAAGELMPWSVAARHVREGLLITTYGGYDAAAETPIMLGRLELTLAKRFTFRGWAANNGMSETLKPGFGMLYDVVLREDYGVDVALGGDYEIDGWNNNSALITRVAAGTNAGDLRVLANAGFGLATNRAERYGDLRLSGLHPVAPNVWAGIDSRARVDLERDTDEPTGELDWDMQAGPVATIALGRFAVSATGGMSAWKLRSREDAKMGAMGAVGVAAAF